MLAVGVCWRGASSVNSKNPSLVLQLSSADKHGPLTSSQIWCVQLMCVQNYRSGHCSKATVANVIMISLFPFSRYLGPELNAGHSFVQLVVSV